MELGGNIELVGFSEEDANALIIVKKIVGNATKKLTERLSGFQRISITHKGVHETQNGHKHEVHGFLEFSGGRITAQDTDHNLYFALNGVLDALEQQALKQKR